MKIESAQKIVDNWIKGNITNYGFIVKRPYSDEISGEILENETIKYKGIEVGKIIISDPYSFGLIKMVEPDLKEFVNLEVNSGTSKIKILKPDWI